MQPGCHYLIPHALFLSLSLFHVALQHVGIYSFAVESWTHFKLISDRASKRMLMGEVDSS